jgi:hypothetical protein
VLFSVVPFSHNCGTKITLISINKAKSYQHLQRLKSVSVNDLAIDVFGCFRVLFSDAEISKDIPQYLIARNLSDNASQMIDRLSDILGGEVCREAGGEAFADTVQGSAGSGEGLDVTLVGDQSGVAVCEEIALAY